MSKTFLITGATGLIGKHIINEVLKRNDRRKNNFYRNERKPKLYLMMQLELNF